MVFGGPFRISAKGCISSLGGLAGQISIVYIEMSSTVKREERGDHHHANSKL